MMFVVLGGLGFLSGLGKLLLFFLLGILGFLGIFLKFDGKLGILGLFLGLGIRLWGFKIINRCYVLWKSFILSIIRVVIISCKG